MRYIVTIFAALLLVSCSVKKRTYRDGYYIDWAYKKNKVSPVKKIDNKIELDEKIETFQVQASTETYANTEVLLERSAQKLLIDTCGDIIFFKSGDQATVKVIEVTEDKIKYKRCDNLEGPTFVVNKAKISLIRYVNGVEEKVETPEAETPVVSDPPQYKYTGPKKMHPKSTWSLITLIVGLVVPFLGFLLIASYILSTSAIKEITAKPDYFKGLKLAKIVRGICKVLFYILIALLILFFMALFLA